LHVSGGGQREKARGVDEHAVVGEVVYLLSGEDYGVRDAGGESLGPKSDAAVVFAIRVEGGGGGAAWVGLEEGVRDDGAVALVEGGVGAFPGIGIALGGYVGESDHNIIQTGGSLSPGEGGVCGPGGFDINTSAANTIDYRHTRPQ